MARTIGKPIQRGATTTTELPRARKFAVSNRNKSDINKRVHETKVKPPKGLGTAGRMLLYEPGRYPHVAYMLCRERGFTDQELADVFGVAWKTLMEWKRKFPEFREAIQAGKDEWDGTHVENALLKRALGYEYQERTVKRVKIRGELADGTKVRIPATETTVSYKVLPPDVKALNIWLVNRMPERWKNITHIKTEKPEGGESGVNLNVNTDLENCSLEQLQVLREIAMLSVMDQNQDKSVKIPSKVDDVLMQKVLDQQPTIPQRQRLGYDPLMDIEDVDID